MAFSQADLAAVQAAIARGERSVQYADRVVTYRSIQELEQAARIIAKSLQTSRSKQTLLVGTKGF